MALFLEPQPALSPVAHDVLADDVLVAGSGAVMPIVIGDIAVRPPLRAYLIVGVVGSRSASYITPCQALCDEGFRTADFLRHS